MKHISDIKKFERCEKLLWNHHYDPQPFSAFVSYNENIITLSLKKLKIDQFYEGRRNDPNGIFLKHEKDYDCFVNMRFEYLGLRIKTNIMVRNQKGYDLYFTYASCFPKEGEAQSIADTMWVLHQLKVKIQNVYCIHLNQSYVRKEELDVEELLVLSEYLYNDRNKQGERVLTLIRKKYRNLTNILKQMDITLRQESIGKERTNICTRRNKCMYFEKCFEQNEDTSIYHLVSSSQKFKLHDAGIQTIDKVNFDEIEGSRHQFAQYMAATKKKLFFDSAAVDQYFQKMKYPISYLDFEWETYAYPPYEGMRPYDVLTFQYSLHIEEQDGTLSHKEFLGKKDCRIPFVESLISQIPEKGSILCFNVEGAEKLRLKQLAKQYPQYETVLQSIWERMIDLAIPFSSGVIYDNRMAGMYSLKKLVSIFTTYSYDDLSISHGMDAVRSYVNLEDHEDQQIIDSLLKYCAMDTYAMYLIYHWILDTLAKRERT